MGRRRDGGNDGLVEEESAEALWRKHLEAGRRPIVERVDVIAVLRVDLGSGWRRMRSAILPREYKSDDCEFRRRARAHYALILHRKR